MKEISELSKICIDLNKRINENLYGEVQNSTIYDEVIKVNSLEESINKKFRPVKFLRYIIANEIKNNTKISSQFIKDIMDAIEIRDVSKYIKLNNSQQESLNSYKKSKKGMYPNWGNDFQILFPFLHSIKDEEKSKDLLERIGQKLIKKYEINDAKVHTVGFNGSQNYGAKECWLAIIPSNTLSHQSCFQLFMSIVKDGFAAGIHKGHKLSEIEYNNKEPFIAEFSNYDEAINHLEKNIEEWKNLNSEINFDEFEDEIKLKSRLKSNEINSNQIFFDFIDKIIEDLSIPNNEKIVFSTGKNMLTFHVGKRIVLGLKKDNFGFISKELSNNSELNINTKYSGGENPNYYDKASENDLHNFYENIKIAISDELKRDNHTKVKGYDNSAFRRAVFDISYRQKFIQSNKHKLFNIHRYYLVGSYWDDFDPKDQTERFLKEGIWENGFNDGTLVNETKTLVNGDYIAIKKSNIRTGEIIIFALGQILKNFSDGKKVSVKWTRVNKTLKITGKNYTRTFAEVTDMEHIKLIFESSKKMKKPINKIFFGPPGTGKTFRINEITDEYFSETSKVVKDIISKRKKSLKFEMLDLPKGTELTFYKDETITCEIIDNERVLFRGEPTSLSASALTILNEMGYKSKTTAGPRLWCYNGKKLSHLRKELESTDTSENKIRKKNFTFVTFHQSFSYEDFIEGIKPVIDADDLKYEIRPGVFKEICERAWKDKNNKYAIFIDEINRGNVSSIFGELITLIEPDKRETMSTILPYSQEPFSVPKNLDIYGTMNTADRSVEALDTALRRRFVFEELPPDQEHVTKEIDGLDIDIKKLFNTINKRIEKLIDKDHMIGHSYFMNLKTTDDLKSTFQNKVIPLLQEYFFGDFGKIGLILGEGFVEKDSESESSTFANFSDYDDGLLSEKEIYRLNDVTNIDDVKFEEILKKLFL